MAYRLLPHKSTGQQTARERILHEFVLKNHSKTGPELEIEFRNGASLFLTRLCAHLKTSVTCKGPLGLTLQAISVFIAAASGKRFLNEFIDVGGLQVAVDILKEDQSLEGGSQLVAARLLLPTAGLCISSSLMRMFPECRWLVSAILCAVAAALDQLNPTSCDLSGHSRQSALPAKPSLGSDKSALKHSGLDASVIAGKHDEGNLLKSPLSNPNAVNLRPGAQFKNLLESKILYDVSEDGELLAKLKPETIEAINPIALGLKENEAGLVVEIFDPALLHQAMRLQHSPVPQADDILASTQAFQEWILGQANSTLGHGKISPSAQKLSTTTAWHHLSMPRQAFQLVHSWTILEWACEMKAAHILGRFATVWWVAASDEGRCELFADNACF